MSDILKRLRNDGDSWAQSLFNDAALEIENLRVALKECSDDLEARAAMSDAPKRCRECQFFDEVFMTCQHKLAKQFSPIGDSYYYPADAMRRGVCGPEAKLWEPGPSAAIPLVVYVMVGIVALLFIFKLMRHW